MAKSMIGIDVGVCELKMAIWDGKKVKKLISVPMLENLVKDGVIVSYDAMADFIKESIKGSRSGDAAVILPANYCFIKRLNLPKMNKQQLEVNLPYEFRDFLTQSKEKYFYDYAVNGFVDNKDGQGETMDLLAACSAKDIIGEYRTMFKRCGLKLATAIPMECSYLNLIYNQKEYEKKDFAFVDFGYTSTRLYIFKGSGYEVTRVIDYGMKTVCEAIADYYNVDDHMALGYLLSNYENCQALDGPRGVYEVIAAEIRKAINFYSFNNPESVLEGLWCCGGGANNETLRTSIVEGSELQIMGIKDLLPECPADSNPVSFVSAIGAAMQRGL